MNHLFLNLWYNLIKIILYNIQFSVVYIIRSYQKMKIKVRRFARSDYKSDFSKVSSQLTTKVLFEAQLVFQGVCPLSSGVNGC